MHLFCNIFNHIKVHYLVMVRGVGRSLFIVNLIGLVGGFAFMLKPYLPTFYNLENNIFWSQPFAIIWPLLFALITAMSIVLSIYYPPILKDIKDLTKGINKLPRKKIIAVNPVSVAVDQMVFSCIVLLFILVNLFIFYLSVTIHAVVLTLVFLYAILVLCYWMLTIKDLAQLDYTDYIRDTLLVLHTDSGNQRSYFTIIKRQLERLFADKDTYGLNSDLIKIVNFINKDKYNTFTYCYDYCIKSLFNRNEIESYLDFIDLTYYDPARIYYYSRHPVTDKTFNIPAENTDKWQNYMFSTEFRYLEDFICNIVEIHSEILTDEQQYRLINYYLWLLNMLCSKDSSYIFTYTMDISKKFKNTDHTRIFLSNAMKIILSKDSLSAADGLLRGFISHLCANGIDAYVQLEEKDGSTAWLFKDLIYLVMIYAVLSNEEQYPYTFAYLQFLWPKLIILCAKDTKVFQECMTFIYFFNRIMPTFKITLESLKQSLGHDISSDLKEAKFKTLFEFLKGDNTYIVSIDAITLKYTRAIEDNDFFSHPKIEKSDYYRIFKEVIK